jgi:dolichol-phosphate mannosyltransferase
MDDPIAAIQTHCLMRITSFCPCRDMVDRKERHTVPARMDAGSDVVFGQRTERRGETLFKKTSAFVFYRLLNKLIDIDIPQDTGDVRFMSRRAVDILDSMPEHQRFIRGMVSWIGLHQEAVPYERAARFAGETKYPISKMIRFAIDAVTGFSTRPLILASYLGICFGITTLVLMVYALVQYFFGHTIEGWTSLAVIILGVSSVQLFVAGVMGEYLGRLYMQSKGRLLFTVQEVVCFKDTSNVVYASSAQAMRA